MKEKFSSVSFFGRLAYIIMCVEKFLVAMCPSRDWTLVAEKMWMGTSLNLLEWNTMFGGVIPSIVMNIDSGKDFEQQYSSEWDITKEEFLALKQLYSGVTEGREYDPADSISYMIQLPFEMTTDYEGTSFGDGEESYQYIEDAESMLNKYGIPLPDYTKVAFSSIKEFHGWGNYFDGRFLSIILNPDRMDGPKADEEQK